MNRHLFTVAIWFLTIVCHGQTIKFRTFGLEDGFTGVTVTSTVQDPDGVLWIGTWSGLYRYDGYTFKGYWHSEEDTNSLAYDWIVDLAIDDQGRLWVGTHGGGLDLFDIRSESFQHFKHDRSNPATLTNDAVGRLMIDSRNQLWIGTTSGLARMDLKTLKIKRIPYKTPSGDGIIGGSVSALHEDDDGVVWIGTGNYFYDVNVGALNAYDPNTERIENYLQESDSLSRMNHSYAIISMNDSSLLVSSADGRISLFDKASHSFTPFLDLSAYNTYDPLRGGVGVIDLEIIHDHLVITAYRAGLIVYDLSTGKLQQYVSDPTDPYSLKDNRPIHTFKDHEDQIWLSGFNGLTRFTLSSPIQRINLPVSGNGKDAWITSIVETQSGVLLASANKIYQWNKADNSFLTINLPTSGCNDWKLNGTGLASAKSYIWVVNSCGVYHYDPLSNDIKRVDHPINSLKLVSDNPAKVIATEKITWINAQPSPLGMTADSIIHFEDPFQLAHRDVEDIYVDHHNDLWISTSEGLNRWDHQTGEIASFLHQQAIQGIPAITSVKTTASGVVWLTSDTYGIGKFDPETQTLKKYSIKYGIHSGTLYELLIDRDENIWALNEDGLTYFQPETGKSKIILNSDGLVETKFDHHILTQLSSGEILVGGKGGVSVIDPQHIFSSFYPVISLQSVVVNDERMDFDNSPFTLTYNRNNINIGYLGTLLSSVASVSYQYQLTNYDEDFIQAGTQRIARYSNLPPGSYTFQVKVSNAAKEWSDPKSLLSFTILPPWWRTWWFYFGAGAALVLLFYFVRKYEISRIRLANELEFKQKEANRLQELDAAKSNFFANISHEFRTPLTLILGQLELTLEKVGDSANNGLEIAQQNADKLLRLVNRLLDLSKIESGKMQTTKSAQDLIPFLKNQFLSFETLAHDKNIELKFHSQLKRCIVWYDEELMSEIITNLIHNAIKFTDGPGAVQLTIQSASDQYALIAVSDTGKGIPKEALSHIFQRFYQVNDGVVSENAGTGIGLSLVKELVHLHEGSISVESELGQGTTFIVSLPAMDLEAGEVIVSSSPGSTERAAAPGAVKIVPVIENGEQILIVEDNPEVRQYLSDCLSERFNIHTASDGSAGLARAREMIPDLIISDIMMPKMNGYEFCEHIRSNSHTSHIPVIMLTARAAKEDRIKGLKLGVDDFLVKPFHKEELFIRIENLLKLRKQLQEKYATARIIKPSEIEASSVDQQFLKKVIDFIDANLSDEGLNLDRVADEVHMSVSQLNRKMNAIVGQPPGQLLRSMRLDRARDLLAANSGSVSEIAFQCGFSDLASFTRSFKKEFDQSPSQFAKPK